MLFPDGQVFVLGGGRELGGGAGPNRLTVWRFGHLKLKTMKNHVINEKRNTMTMFVNLRKCHSMSIWWGLK